jgi:homocysteine S-methyltransferase
MAAITMTDGGLETSLIYHQGIDLPAFAAFPLLDEPDGRAALRTYFEPYLAIADARGVPLIVDTPTWRANTDWGAELGYDPDELARINTTSVDFARSIAGGRASTTVNGTIGPRGDGYVVGARMSADEAAEYHLPQVIAFHDGGADQVTAMTLTYAEEAVGIVRAAASQQLPVVIAFTLETDGRLPDGSTLADAIALVDRETATGAAFFMVNCVHPSHVLGALDDGAVAARVGGLRVNASRRSHAELDAADELDDGDPAALAAETVALRSHLPALRVIGGCCGTDHRHVERMLAAW